MADTVDTLVVANTKQRYVVRLTNRSDGTGESGVVKVDKSTLTGLLGAEPSKLVVEKIQYDVAGMQVRLDWDHTTDDEIVTLGPGSGVMNWRQAGGLIDPGSAGGTGDILLTTNGQAAGDSYDITLHLRKKG